MEAKDKEYHVEEAEGVAHHIWRCTDSTLSSWGNGAGTHQSSCTPWRRVAHSLLFLPRVRCSIVEAAQVPS